MKKFLINILPILIALITIPFIGVTIAIIIFHPSDTNTWINIIMSIVSYSGSSLLGIFVFYHSWQIEEKQKRKERIQFSLFLFPFANEQQIFTPWPRSYINTYDKSFNFSGDDDKYTYMLMNLKNLNPHYPLYYKILDTYCITKEGEVKKHAHPFTVGKADSILEYGKEQEVFIGTPNDIFPLDYHKNNHSLLYFVCIKFEDSFGKQLYYIRTSIFTPTTVGSASRTYSAKKYNKLIKKHGHPIELSRYLKGFLKMNQR